MKNLYLTSIFCFCAAINSACAGELSAAGEDPCMQMRYSPRLNMTTSYGKLRYDYQYDRRSLTRLGQQYGLVAPGMTASGLSLFGIDWSVTLNTAARIAADGSICILPTSVDVFIGFQDPTIYIDKDLNKESCRYRLALRHEHQHQQISVAALEYFIPRIREKIIRLLPEIMPKNVSSLSQTDATTVEMNEDLIRRITPLVDTFKATLLYEHKKLDNTENYRYESTVCRKFP